MLRHAYDTNALERIVSPLHDVSREHGGVEQTVSRYNGVN